MAGGNQNAGTFTVDPGALAAEITTDPKALGYTGHSDYEIAQMLNTPGLSGETLFKSYTATEDVVACIVRAEYDALTAAPKAYLDMVLRPAKVKTGDATLRTQIAAVFGAATTTRANLVAVASRPACRAEILFGENASVNDQQVAAALRPQ
jgi:hypothetical protein